MRNTLPAGLFHPGAGGFSHWHGIRICACLLGHFFAKFGIAIGGFSSETKEPKLHKLGVFWANYCKKHPIWSKLGAFLSKMVYWWVGNLAKNWYRDSQIFEVRQAHPRTILVKEPPPPGFSSTTKAAMHEIHGWQWLSPTNTKTYWNSDCNIYFSLKLGLMEGFNKLCLSIYFRPWTDEYPSMHGLIQSQPVGPR